MIPEVAKGFGDALTGDLGPCGVEELATVVEVDLEDGLANGVKRVAEARSKPNKIRL